MGVSGEYDVVVVGGGIMGSCTAYEVAKRGHSVLLLEQFDFLHRRGSSHGETRNIRLTYPEPYYTHMMKEAFSLWSQAQQEAGYLVHTPTLKLDFGPKDDPTLHALASSCTLNSVPFDTLTPSEARSCFPTFAFPDGSMALVTESGGVIHASKAVAMFQALALKHGATLCDRVVVQNIVCASQDDGNPGVLVTTDQGSVIAGKCVVSAGAWTSKLVKQVCGLDLPIQPLHTTISYWQIEDDAADAFSVSNGHPTFTSYGDPHVYGNASIELPGLLKVNLDAGYECDPDNRALVPDLKALKELVSPWLETHFKGKVKAEAPVLAEACMYSMTPDHDYILDFLPLGNKLVAVAGGFSGHGFKMGPVVGRVMADLCLKGSCENVPLEHFSISRFSHNPRGNVKSWKSKT